MTGAGFAKGAQRVIYFLEMILLANAGILCNRGPSDGTSVSAG
jgi:hypothetical protein